MAEKYNMKLVEKKTFADYFDEQITKEDGRGLIGRMQSLEVHIICYCYWELGKQGKAIRFVGQNYEFGNYGETIWKTREI